MNDWGMVVGIAFLTLLPLVLILLDLYKTFFRKKKSKDPRVAYMADHNHMRRRRNKRR